MASREEILRKYGIGADGKVATTAKPKTKREEILSRYGMDASGNIVQKRQTSYGWNMGTPKREDAAPAPLANLGNNGTGGTFLGGYKVTPQKEKRDFTVEDYQAMLKAAQDEEKYQQYLATLDLDEQRKKIDTLKKATTPKQQFFDDMPTASYSGVFDVDPSTYNVEQTELEKELSQAQIDYNKAESVQYDIEGERVLNELDEETRKLVEEFTTGSHVEGMNGWAAEKALREKGYTKDEIAQFADYRSRQINKEKMDAAVQKSIDFANTGAGSEFVGSVWSTPQNLVGGVTGSLSLGMQNLQNWLTGSDRPVDYNAPAFRPTMKANAFREQVAQNIYERGDTELEGNVNAFLYQTGMSMADSAAIYGLTLMGVPSAASTTLLSTSAAVNGAIEAKERGASDEQALFVGVASGAAEWVFERISLQNLLKAKPATGTIRQQVTQMLKNGGIQTGVNASEELFTSLANAITDAIIMGEASAIETAIKDYMAQGMTETEAQKEAYIDFAKQLGLDLLGGAISGAVMGAPAGTINEIARNRAAGEQYSESVQELTKEALDINSGSETAKRVQEKYKEGKKISGGEIRELVLENQKEIERLQKEETETLRRKSPPTLQLDREMQTSDGRVVNTYTTDENGNALWLTDGGLVKNEEQNANTVMGVANKWGGDIGRVVVEQDDGDERYASTANDLIELGIESVDGGMRWDTVAQTGIADALGGDKAFKLYSAGVAAAKSEAYREAYRAGLLGTEWQRSKAFVSDNVLNSAYEMGKRHAAEEAENAKNFKPVVNKNAGFAVSAVASENANIPVKMQKAWDTIGKKLGIQIRMGTKSDNLSEDENGRFDSATGTIILSPNAANPFLFVSSHEITHRLKEVDFEGYKQYRNYVLSNMPNAGVAINDIRVRYQRHYDKVGRKKVFTDLDAMDEIASDYTQAMIEDGNLFRELVNDNRSTARKLLDGLRNFIKKLTEKESSPRTLYGTEFSTMQKAEKMWKKMVDTEEEGTVWDAVVGTRQQGKTVETAQESEYTGDDENGVRHSLQGGYKSVSQQAWRQIQRERMNRYGGHFDSAPNMDTFYAHDMLFVVENLDETHFNVVDVIDPEKQHEKSKYVREVMSNGNIEYASEYRRRLENLRSWQRRNVGNSVSAKNARTRRGDAGAYAQYGDPGNGSAVVVESGGADEVKYSLNTDSKGNQLSEAQVEFFENSTVRDKKGRLIPVYHGTMNDFNVFKRGDIGFHFGTKGAARGRVGYGKNVKVKEVYLNITNPIEFDVDLGSWDADYRLTEELYDRGILSKEEAMSVLRTDDGKNKRNTGAANKMLVGLLKDKGYDGIVYQNYFETNKPTTSYIAFDSNQAKEITNLNPTESLDIRYSLKDSDGNTLTEEQAAYFAESKSVDAQGNLRVMYRGGNSDFTVFDRKKSSYSNLYGRGFYFTDSKSHAEQYGGARAFYLNITNPVPTDETTITKEQLLAFLRAVAENEDDYSFENYGYGATPESVVDAIYSGKSDFAMLYDVSQSAIGDMVEAVELFNEINGTDFDGLILDTETVTFRSEQAKLTSNETPTDDPDIRFSLVTEEQARENNKTALEYFGRTYKWSETGYILLDGSRLDFSGKHEGAPGGYRIVDHRDIRDAFGDDYGGNGYSDSLVQFMREGNIRIMPESGGINLSVMPTREQERALDDFISKERGEVVLDIDDDRGNTVASVEYPRGTRASKVLADIRKYFEDGTMPQVSELAQFRYSLKSDAAMGRTLRDMAEAQNATEKAVKAWVADVHRGKKVDVNIDEAERVAQNLINDYRSSADKFEVTGAVLDLFNYLQNGDGNKNMDTDTIKEKANTVADILLSAEMRGRYYEADFVETPNGMELSDTAQDNEELRKFLRGTKIVFPKEYVSDLGEENWTAFKEGLKGAQARLSDENNRANVDTLYREDLSRMWPQYFPDSITGEAAMMQRIAEVSQRVFARTNRAHSEGEIEAMMQMTASDILDRFFNLPQVGKTYISVRNLREKSTRTVRRLQDQLQVRDSQGSRASIIRKVKALDKKLRDNTEKSHVPDYLRSAVLELCSLFTQNTSVFSKSKLLEIRDAYDDMLQDENMQYVFDEDISDTLKELSKTLDGRRLSELTGEELQWVDDVVSHFTHLVNNANQAFMDDKRVAVADMANKVISKAVTDGKSIESPFAHSEKSWLREADKFLTTGNLKPLYFFENIGGQLRELFQNLLDGSYRYGQLMEQANEFKERVYAKYNADKWLDSKEKLEMTTEHGDSLVLDVNEALSILATFKREVTNREQDAGHLTRGGIVYEDEMARDIKEDKEKKRTLKEVLDSVFSRTDVRSRPVSAADVLEISKWLRQNVSEQAEDFVDEMVSYLSIDMAELGNETSMKLTGIRKYTERFYFPYKTSAIYRATKLSPDQYPALRRPGFSKRTQRKANNPIVLRGFTDVWSEHVSEMITYATVAVPQDTLLRVLNYKDTLVDVEDGTNIYKDVKSAVSNAYGIKSLKYIEDLLKDLNGGVMVDPREKVVSGLVRTYKRNAVGFSFSVVVQQPMSGFRAMLEVDPKYMFNAPRKGDYKQMKQYAGVVVLKEIGGFDTNTGLSGASWLKGEESFFDKAMGYLPQKADQVTWMWLWNVVKAETRDKRPELLDNGKETEAFLKAAGDRFNYVIEKTQVYDSVLTRTPNMRAKNGLVSTFTSFMSEPMVNLNVAVDAIRNGDKTKRARAFGVLFFAIAATSLAKALWTAGRDDDESEAYFEKVLERFVGYAWSDILPWNYVPIVRDISGIFEGYSSEINLLAPIEDTVTAGIKAYNKLMDFGVSGLASEEVVDFVLSVGNIFGVPLENIKRDFETVLNDFTKMAPLDDVTKRDVRNAILEGLNREMTVKNQLQKGWRNHNNPNKRKEALDEISAIYSDKVKDGQKKGKSLEEAKKSAKSSIQSSCTNYLKPIYQSLTGAKKNEVKQFALRISVGGKQLYADYDFSKWDE